MATVPPLALTLIELLLIGWPYIAVVTLVALSATRLLRFLSAKYYLSQIPLAAAEIGGEEKRRLAYMQNAKQIYRDGYDKFKNGVYRISTTSKYPTIVIHPRYLEELKNLPDEVLNFTSALAEARSLFTRYTGAKSDRAIIPHVVKSDLTPALHRLNPQIAEEVERAFVEELPSCEDFIEVNIFSTLLRIVAKVSGSIFIGSELGRSEVYIDTAINYTVERSNAQRAITALPPWQRFFKAKSLPAVQRLIRRAKDAEECLRPVVMWRKEAAKKPGFERPNDLLQWLLDGGQGAFGEQDNKELAAVQLALTSAAMHTTSLTATNAMYSLAVMPAIVTELRDEIHEVLAECGTFTTAALSKMKKLDSFLRESVRCNPLGWTSFSRKSMKNFVLSDGQVIPAGCIIEVPAHSITHDREVIPDPEKFDALRSYRAREQVSEASSKGLGAHGASAGNQLVTASPINLTFGFGRHVCPGRFFAVNQLKMIVGRALIDYDIKITDDATDRYPNIEFAGQSIPDPKRMLLFKRLSS